MRLKQLPIFLMISFLFAGCAKTYPMTPFIPSSSSSERVFVKNYTLGKQQKVMVGESVIKVKDFKVQQVAMNSLEPTENFTISVNNLMLLSGEKEQQIKIAGELKDETGASYYLLQSSLASQFLVPVNIKTGTYDGHFGAKALNGIEFHKDSGFSIIPLSTHFVRTEKKNIDTKAGYVNYEILYTGMTKDAINFLYREYTSEDMARPAFYQNLTYPRNAKTIRFKSTKINLVDINEESVTYAVVEE